MARNGAAAGGNGAAAGGNGAEHVEPGGTSSRREPETAETGDGLQMKKDGRGYFFCGGLPGERRQQGRGYPL